MFEAHFRVSSNTALPAVPVRATIPCPPDVALEDLALTDAAGVPVACQAVHAERDVELTWIAGPLLPSVDVVFRLCDGGGPASLAAGVQVIDAVPNELGFLVAERPFTTYEFSPEHARPYFFPVLTPSGRRVTRNYPMLDVPGETHDHVHHRSIWVAHGDVNNTDNWSEEPGHAWIRHQGFDAIWSGPVWGGFAERNLWVGPDGSTPVVAERRRVAIYAVPGGPHIMDLEVTFAAAYGEVRFGDTKEGGLASVRVATSMDGDKGGLIRTSAGGRGEAECWGKRADWCSYTGVVAGGVVGVAILDHPRNPRHPTYWHVRDYGLMTANPFGVSYFENNRLLDGSLTVEAGAEVTFRYRLLVHDGDADAVDVAGHYAGYASPPRVELVDGP